MADTKLVGLSSLKKGSNIVLDGFASTVTDIKVSRPGKHGHAKYNIMAVGILDGKKRNAVMPGHDKVPVPIIGKENAQVLSVAGKSCNVMDMQNYVTFDLDIPADLAGKIEAGQIIVYWTIMDSKVLKQVKQEAD